MRISFQHANPSAGNESFLLRFDGDNRQNPCLLVDAGRGVALDTLLNDDDCLVAICLTHAHLDHYAELANAHREGVPILTSPATARILDDVLDVAGVEYDVRTTDAVSGAIMPIDDWIEIADGIELSPVPAGHVPGAVGFLVRVAQDNGYQHLLATGDFTCRRAAGYPGFDANRIGDVDILFLTGTTNTSFESSLTEALGLALERASSGSPTLVTTSGTVGVQMAYLLAGLGETFDRTVPIRVVGQVAKLYAALGYDCHAVETVPEFQSTHACLAPGTITIAGPEVPRDRSSGRLFGVLRANANACVIQLVGSGKEPERNGACTIHHFELINHPSRETLVSVHDSVDPVHTVITHCHGGAHDSFNDLSSVVWGAGDCTEYTLYDGSHWRLPPWMDGTTFRQSHQRNVQQLAGSAIYDSLSLPSIDRDDDPALSAEGLDVAAIGRRLHQRPVPTGDPAVQTDAQPVKQTDSHTTTRMTTHSNDGTDSSTDDGRPSIGIVRSTGPNLGDDPDPHVQIALEDGSLTQADLAAMLTKREQTGGVSMDNSVVSTPTTESETEPASQETDDATSAETHTTDDTDGAGSVADEMTTGAANGDDPPSETKSSAPTDSVSTPDDALTVAVPGLARVLLERSIAGTSEHESIDTAIVAAVEQYVIALLGGDADGTEPLELSLAVEGSDATNRVLETVVTADDRFDSIGALVQTGIASVLGADVSGEMAVSGLGAYRQQLRAIVANDAYAFADRAAVVEAAILWYYLED
ncbi:MBL fold metallo-hydrolase [Halocatena halophila]|uniref:MBL fold metallo-hydrolase n=1 Tax=Halocatena halophila TaxID=2814576 RepID=UPI002ED2D480